MGTQNVYPRELLTSFCIIPSFVELLGRQLSYYNRVSHAIKRVLLSIQKQSIGVH